VQFILSALLSGDFLMTCEDITVMRKLASQLRQAQKMEAIGTLAGGIAHDFNNILTAIMGYATLLKMGMEASRTFQSYVEQILSASQKAADLTQGLLTFSRQQPISYVPLDINKTIKGTEKLLRRLLTEDIEFRISLSREDVVVMSDKSQMDQIYFNLIANARDAMPKGGILILETRIVLMDTDFMELHGFGQPGRYVLITISDSGMGMDAATREKIFDPFFTTKALGKGTGLGLATVYGIVKQHNGYILLESEPNRGTIFYIYLPTVQKQINDECDECISAATGTETILIAEDDPAVRQLMREALEQRGYTIIEAFDGEVAIEMYEKHPHIDLVILDSVMPKKNGREVYEEMHGINPCLRVLFISGYTQDVVLEKGIEEKSFDFIPKPMSLEKVLQKIREILDR
jgi:nitrogen-specific signal transduction histidine kinase